MDITHFHYTVQAEVELSIEEMDLIKKESTKLNNKDFANKVDKLLKRFKRKDNPYIYAGKAYINSEEAKLLANALEDWADEGYYYPQYKQFIRLAQILKDEFKRVNNLVKFGP